MALAAPPLVRTIESSQSRSEELRLASRLKVFSAKAFVNESNVVLNFEGQSMTVAIANQQQKFKFDHISFPKQRVVYGPIGLPNVPELTVRSGKHEHTLTLYP